MDALPSSEASSISALADHLGVAAEDLNEWVRHPTGIPSEVLLSWIGRWNVGRLTRS